MDFHTVQGLLQELQQKGENVRANDDRSRQDLLAAARSLVSVLESPSERIGRLSWYEGAIACALRIVIARNVPAKMLENGSSSPKTVKQLAEMTEIDPVLLARLLKLLATANIVTETGPDEYIANPFTKTLATPAATGAFTDSYDNLFPIYAQMVEFLNKTGWKNPTDKDKSAFKFVQKTDLHYFEWVYLPEHAFKAEQFHQHMAFKTLGEKWYEVLPMEEIFGKDPDPTDVLLVDVGGSGGHDILGFHKAHPDLPGRLVLQDLPETIKAVDINLLKPIEPMAYDFFTPQPVQGAGVYYMKMVLHDWPDESAVKILANQKSAMKAGRSKILINEVVIPEIGADWFSTSVDMLMMAVHSAAERREQQWREVVENAGLKIAKIWAYGTASERLIEVHLP